MTVNGVSIPIGSFVDPWGTPYRVAIDGTYDNQIANPYTTNTGAAFGMLQGQDIFLTVTAVIGMAAIVFYYAFPPLEHGILRAALGLQLGGAIGNLVDRVRFGEVTDFIHFPHYPAFNVADSSISVGLVVIIAFFVLTEGRRTEAQTNDA